MTAVNPLGVWILLSTTLLSFALTRLLIVLAQRNGWVNQPKADRWSRTPTALYGGVAIYSAFALGSLAFLPGLLHSQRYDLLGLLAGGFVIFAVGLRDDLRALNPLVKLAGEFMSVMPFLVGLGLAYPSATFTVCLPFVLLWMVALTNAFNLLDNMDGLTAGTSVIIGNMLALTALARGVPLVSLFSALIAAACLGFLWFNLRAREPAHIIMGDCSSLFLGYMLAGLAVVGICPPTTASIASLPLPLLIMALPIFDTTLVIILRKREHRAISQGGKDHSSHRLVYAGLSEKQAVFSLYGISLITGGIALSLERLNQPLLLVAVLLACAAALACLGIFLSRYSGMRQAAVTATATEPNLSQS